MYSDINLRILSLIANSEKKKNQKSDILIFPEAPVEPQQQLLSESHHILLWKSGVIVSGRYLKKRELNDSLYVSLRFVLSSMESSHESEPVIHYTGLSSEAVASSLNPFTQYTAILEVSV